MKATGSKKKQKKANKAEEKNQKRKENIHGKSQKNKGFHFESCITKHHCTNITVFAPKLLTNINFCCKKHFNGYFMF